MTAMLDVVPPDRLGGLLAEARARNDESVADVASRSPYTAEELEALEAGDAGLAERSTEALLRAYGVTLDELVPPRRQVLVDLEQGELLVAERSAQLGDDAAADDVLSAYVALVYALRDCEPGESLPLRGHDLAVLARVLGLSDTEVRARLQALMLAPTPEVEHLTRGLRRKLVIPVVGALVIATAALVVVLRDDSADPTPPTPTRIEEAPPVVPEPTLIPPESVER